MSGIWISRIELITTSSEIVGYKSGLGLNRNELTELVPDEYRNIWTGDDRQIVRIRPEQFEELISSFLYKVGNIPTSRPLPFGLSLYHRYKNDDNKLNICMDVMSLFPDFIEKGIELTEKKGTKGIDPRPFVEEARRKYGLEGSKIAIELLEDMNQSLHVSPWSTYRREEWVDTAQLEDLFRSESLETFYGSFIDQRFIDYLDHNFMQVDQMNWRKFEALTCEFFERNGYYVEIGGGRDDDGVDARVWLQESNFTDPPNILVQCKRQKSKVEKVVVKALWADVLGEKAKSGLIVTTSSLSPGARKVCTARGYSINEANRQNLKKWIKEMRTPYKGIFMGE